MQSSATELYIEKGLKWQIVCLLYILPEFKHDW